MLDRRGAAERVGPAVGAQSEPRRCRGQHHDAEAEPALPARIEHLRERTPTRLDRPPALQRASEASLPQRLEALRAENQRPRDENASLKAELAIAYGRFVESGGDGEITTMGTAPRYTIQVSTGYAVTIRNEGDQFALGHGFDADSPPITGVSSAWTFDASYVNQGLVYRLGYLYGSYNGCGWINVDSLNYSGSTGNYYCPTTPVSYHPSIFASLVNCQPGQCTNGSFVRVDRCTSFGEYGNVRPWTTTSASQKFRDISNPSKNYAVDWRYVSKDGRWVMAMDNNYAHGYGRWVFIWRDCLPATLPSSYTKWTP